MTLKSAKDILPAVYGELRRLAAAKLASQAVGQTLQPTALVHEAWLKLAREGNPEFSGRSHFFAAAAAAMRHILIDQARRKRSARHGGGLSKVDLDQANVAAAADSETLLMIDEALEKLSKEDSVAAELVVLRFFAGLTNEEAAETLGISERTAKRYWTFARAWLYREIASQKGA